MPVDIFISYAHEDQPLLNQLSAHLAGLQKRRLLDIWSDSSIVPGIEWKKQIQQHLENAQVILLLISADFLASVSCNIEMREAIERHEAGKARVVPILLRPVDYKGSPLDRFTMLPSNGVPITAWTDQETAFHDVVRGIKQVVNPLLESKVRSNWPNQSQTVVWNVPFARNPFFTGREEELAYLHDQLQQSSRASIGQAQAISGLGGIGKTQLAVEYAYRYRQDYVAVLWAHAESTEALISSYVAIASLLRLPEREAKEQEIIVQAVKRWLQTEKDWLLIVDNADEPQELTFFLPASIGGQILLTTRASTLGHLGIAHSFIVGTFTAEQGALFLLRRAGMLAPGALLDQASPSDRDQAVQICEQLDGLPLALDQTGAYIEATGQSLAGYLRFFQQHRARLLKRRGGWYDHPEPVATTWTISFERLAEQNPAAADLLRFCAFLAPNSIPEEILTEGAKELGSILAPVVADPFLLDEAIESLRAYSLIIRDPHAQTLTVHRLVQAVLRDTLPAGTRQQWMQRAVFAVDAAFPHAAFESWSICERLLSHALVCATWIEQAQITKPAAARLLFRTGSYLHDRARYAEAEPLLKRTLAIYEQQLGPEHPQVAAALNGLADLYREQGKYSESEPLFQRALHIREQELGATNPDTASSLSNLAGLYEHQGRYGEAEPLLKRALVIWEQKLGATHPDAATSLNNLAEVYRAQGKYLEAEPLYRRALTIREQELGTTHPDTATSLNNLALLYKTQGKYEEAEPLLKRALAICEQQLGATHPDTATSLNNLARLYYAQGKYEEAEPLLKRALAICEHELGATHPNTAGSLNNLAALYYAQGKYEEAEPLYQRALAICEQQLGATHPNTAQCLNNLAALYSDQGKYKEAEPLFQRAHTIREQVLELERPDTAQSAWWLAIIPQQHYQEVGKGVEKISDQPITLQLEIPPEVGQQDVWELEEQLGQVAGITTELREPKDLIAATILFIQSAGQYVGQATALVGGMGVTRDLAQILYGFFRTKKHEIDRQQSKNKVVIITKGKRIELYNRSVEEIEKIIEQ